MQNSTLKYSIEEAHNQATILRTNAEEMQKILDYCKQQIDALNEDESFRTISASCAFYEKIEDAAKNFPKFITAIHKFADFLDIEVAKSYQEADTTASTVQQSLEEQVAALQSSGNIGAN